jgi:methylmalonyl-CoA mutase N-terminal domain/subunit
LILMLYKPSDIKNLDYERDLGDPGAYPFTRGIYPSMYAGRLWTMRQYAGYGTAEESNERYKYLIEHGQTGLSVAFDLPTQMGYDSDHPYSEGEVGKCGVAVDTLGDMEALFDGIPLDRVSTSMTINATAPVILAMYIAVAGKQGASPAVLEGTVQNDILKEYIARGAYIYPPAASLKLAVDIITHCSEHCPKWNAISISGYHIREAGATAAQEIAFAIANGMAYVEAVVQRGGLDVDSFAPRISFFFNAHNDFLEEIAKFRAARRLWAKIMKKQFQAKNPRSWMLRFHTQTAGCTLTAQEPENNIVRVAVQALAAVLGGTQSLHTNSYDEALSLPSEQAVKVALRTQQLIGYESGVPEYIDPLGGAYCIESMTGDLERKAQGYLDEIEAMGGAVTAIENGYFQKEIHQSARQYQKRIESGEINVVGVNKFAGGKADDRPPVRIPAKAIGKQLSALKKIKRKRDRARVGSALGKLTKAAINNENLMRPILDCVKEYATVGEVSDALREVYGEYREKNIF